MTTTFGKLTVPVPKSTLGPQDIPKYLEQCEQHLLTATVPHIAEALKAPEAFANTAWDNTPATDDHALTQDYKDVADPDGADAKPKIDAMNKRVFTIIYAAVRQADHRMLTGIMDSAPFVRYSTFRTFVHSKFGGTTKTGKTNLEEVEAEICTDPNRIDKLINIDTTKKVSDTSQMVDFFARIATSQFTRYKLTAAEHSMETVFKLITFRLKNLPSNSGRGKRYTDDEWKTVEAVKGDIAKLERVLCELDLNKPGEDDVEVQDEPNDYDALSTGGGSINYMAQGGGGGARKQGNARGQRRVKFQLPFGPSEAKSRTDCPNGQHCTHAKRNSCFYKHGSTHGLTEWPKKPNTSKDKGEYQKFKKHAADAKEGTVYVLKDKGNGKRLYAEEPEAAGDTRTSTTASRKKKTMKKGKGRPSGVSFGLGINVAMTMSLAVGSLFCTAASATTTVYNKLLPAEERTPTFHTAFSIASPTSKLSGCSFAFDTGCSTSGCVKDAKCFWNLKLRKDINPIKAANGQLLKVHGTGDIKLEMKKKGSGTAIILIRNVYFVPDLTFNVFSGTSLKKDKFTFNQTAEESTITLPDGDKVMLKEHSGLQFFTGKVLKPSDARPAVNDTNTYKLQDHCNNIVAGITTPTENTVDDLIRKLNEAPTSHQARDPIRKALAKLKVYTTNEPATDGILQMHAALGHPSAERLTTFLKSYLSPAQLHKQFGAIASVWCEGCELAKVTRAKKTGKPIARAEHFAKGTTYDVIGPYPPGKGTGFKYAVVFVDEATNHITVRGLKKLTEVPQILDDHFSWLQTVQSASVTEKRLYQGHVGILHPDSTKRAHSDSATYFLSKAAKEVYKKHNASHTASSPYSQHQNRTERQIRTLKTTANAMLIAAHGTHGNGLDDTFWFFALARAATCYNILPTTTNEHFISPQECITGKPPTHHNNHPFGNPCAALIMAKRLKSDPSRGELAIWLGYNNANKSHILHVPRKGTAGSFRQTRHIRLPKRLMSNPLLNGSVHFDAEQHFVHQRDRFAGETTAATPGGAATSTTYSEAEHVDDTTTTEVEDHLEVQPIPTDQAECADDEVFISSLTSVNGTDVETNADTRTWELSETTTNTSGYQDWSGEQLDEQQLLDNIDNIE